MTLTIDYFATPPSSDYFAVPPNSKALREGRLKLTPANKALTPVQTSQEDFMSPDLRAGAFYGDDKSLLLHGDVKQQLQKMIDAGLKVDAIVTSPPYYGQRDYGVDGQMGLEEHPKDFISGLVEVFDLCFQVLKDTGSLWVNIGDTYWSGKGAHKSVEAKQGARRFGVRPQDRPGDGAWARPKQQLLIPHRLAIALQDEGWLVRNDNVWIKPNPVPDQVRDRSSASHEYVFHFTKSRWYYYDRHPVGRPMPSGSVLPPLSTWSAAKSAGGTRHRASFSEELVRIPVLATVPVGGIVLDPFNGSGTTMTYARRNGRRSIGIDLSEEYCQITEERLLDLKKAEEGI